MKRQLLDILAEGHDFDVPEGMVEAEFNQIWQQLTHEAGHEEDPEAALAEIEAEKDDYRKIAVRRVRLGLLLSEIGQSNGIEITAQEFQMLVSRPRSSIARKTVSVSPNTCRASRWWPPSFARRCMRKRSSTSCSTRPK
jgi:FKBP-type peptidyl-prolyl cis-trans isomerase (trigger factor)